MFDKKAIVTSVNILCTFSLCIGNSKAAYFSSQACVDALPNCSYYGPASCGGPFEHWGRKNCANYCHYCKGTPPPAPECKDVRDDCDTFLRSACTDPKYSTWAHDECRYFCRLCPLTVLRRVDNMTTTVAPKDCVDILDCKLYDKAYCGGNYEYWARTNCPAYCQYCTPLPTPQQPCHDLVPNCDKYVTEICTTQIFLSWTKEHCRKFCKFC